MPYKLVCFDMDGVLYSSEKMIATAFQDAVIAFCTQEGVAVPVPSLSRIMEEVGRPIQTIYQNLFPELSEQQQEVISRLTLSSLVIKVREKKGTLLPNAFQTLQRFHEAGILIGLASNGRAPYLDAILETYRIACFFPERAVIDGKDLPDKGSLITHAMERHGILSGDTLMVGDRLTDYDAARQAGVDFACVLTGHGSDFLDHQFSYSIGDLQELLPVVLGETYAGV